MLTDKQITKFIRLGPSLTEARQVIQPVIEFCKRADKSAENINQALQNFIKRDKELRNV